MAATRIPNTVNFLTTKERRNKFQLAKNVTAMMLAFGLGIPAANADDSTFDPRALAMGGTGVTASNARNAAFQNPAVLAAKSDDWVALEAPIISLRLQDQNNLHSDVSQMKTNANGLTSAAQNFNSAYNAYVLSPTPANLTAAANAAQGVVAPLNSFNNSIKDASDKNLMADLFAGAMLGAPSKKHGWTLYVDEHAEVGARFNYAPADQALVSNFSTNLSTCSTGNAAACTSAFNSTGSNGSINGMQSQLQVRAVRIKEIGLSMAHYFPSVDQLDIGITPKLQQINTYDYAVGAQQGNSISLNQGENSYSAYNMDVGVVKSYVRRNGDGAMLGFVVKNMFSRSFSTVLGDHIDIKPQATVGASYQTKLTTVGVDLDAIPNKPLINGFSKESQYLRLGAEFDAWRWAQFRIGWRHDMKGNYPNLPSVGFGLAPFGVIHIDFSAAYASSKEGAASLQLGFNF